MPKINVYLPDELADAVRDAQVPVSAICQTALEHAVREVSALRGSEEVPTTEPGHGARVRQRRIERTPPRTAAGVRFVVWPCDVVIAAVAFHGALVHELLDPKKK